VLEALHHANCDAAQGYYLARQMPIGDLPRFLATIDHVTVGDVARRDAPMR
jgi:EAL domain-containing protein (putative c-di-GMP-specific phosphodiesterase class I)